MLLQKTFCTDVISKKIVKISVRWRNIICLTITEGIVSREQYNAVKAEMARRAPCAARPKRL